MSFDINRRNFLKNLAVATVGASGAALVNSQAASGEGVFANTFPHLNVKDFGAVGDGNNDDTTPFQNALNAAQSQGGGVVIAPRGNYKILGTLYVPANVTLEGVFRAPQAYSQQFGTTLLAYSGANNPNGTPFITLAGHNSTLKGVTIFYPNQTTNVIPYPWTIRGGDNTGGNDNISIQDVLLVNSYYGVDFATYECGRHLIKGLYGQPLKIGINVDKCYDIGRIEDVHFWPFWNNSNSTLLTSVGTTASALILKHTDWQIVHNFFAFGYHVGVQCTSGTGGIGPNGQFSNLNLDQVNVGIDIYRIENYGISISNLNIACNNTPAYSQSIRRGIWAHTEGTTIGPLRIQNGSFWGNFRDEIIYWGKGNALHVTSSTFRGWGQNFPPPRPAILIVGGRAIIEGNYFQDVVGNSVNIGSGANRVVVVGNDLVGNPVINNPTSNPRLIANNLA